MARRIETLLFDFGGTLDSDGVAWKDRIHRLYGAEGFQMTAENFAPAFYAADDGLADSLPVEANLAETVGRLTRNLDAMLAQTAPAADSGGGRGQRVAARFLAEANASFARNRPLLAALGARYRLGIVSNFYGNLEAVCRGAGLAPLFAVMVDSRRVGAEKPDPAIFEAALKPLAARPETTIYVGDSLPRDREGARRMGMEFVWIATPEAQAVEARRAGEASIQRSITKLGQLAEILA